jgi:hypothetical protein
LPYYSNSTNNRYFEAHSEYNDEAISWIKFRFWIN